MSDKKGRIGVSKLTMNSDGKEFYIKTLKNPILEQPFPTYFQDEIDLLNALQHPCLLKPKISDFDPKKGYRFTTEKMQNGSLADLFQGSKPDFYNNMNNKMILLLSIAHAMAYLHRNAVLHGNLHPGNILITDKWTTKIADYDLNWFIEKSPAQQDAENGRATVYMSPELIKGTSFDSSIDVYAYGTILYQVLLGHRPYARDNPYKVALYIGGSFIYPIDFPQELKAFEKIVRDCWGPKSKRPSFDHIIMDIMKILSQGRIRGVNFKSIQDILQYFNSSLKEVLPQNAPKYYQFMKFGAIAGDPRPMIDYAETFMDGAAWPPNYEKGLYYMRLAAENGNGPACQKLAEFLEEGKFVKQDLIEAYDLYETASQDEKCTHSKYKFATFLINGIGGIKDPQRGFAECKKAAEAKDPDATNYLGELYENGIGTKQDLSLAKKQYQEADKLGNPKGKYNLARLLEKNKSRWSEIISLYEQAAAKEQPDALNRLGELLLSGQGVKHPDPERAFNLFMLASVKGNTRAKYNFALLLLKQNNSEVAMDYMREAAKDGCIEAQHYLAQH